MPTLKTSLDYVSAFCILELLKSEVLISSKVHPYLLFIVCVHVCVFTCVLRYICVHVTANMSTLENNFQKGVLFHLVKPGLGTEHLNGSVNIFTTIN